MKIQMLKAIVATTTLAAIGLGATAANAATATATARAKILRQLTVINTSDLQFGVIVTGAAASTVAVSTAGVVTCGAGLVCTGTTTAAGFTLGGTTGQVVTVSVPANVGLSNGSGGTMSATLAASAPTVTLVALAGTFTVGGVLSVAANQADGDYTGTFIATVNYQ